LTAQLLYNILCVLSSTILFLVKVFHFTEIFDKIHRNMLFNPFSPTYTKNRNKK